MLDAQSKVQVNLTMSRADREDLDRYAKRLGLSRVRAIMHAVALAEGRTPPSYAKGHRGWMQPITPAEDILA